MKKIYFLTLLTLLTFNIFGQAPANGLVAYYPFNGNANDAMGTYHGTVNGATLTTDRKGNISSAYSFNGTNNYIQVPHSSVFNISGPITLSVWFNTNDVNLSQRIIDKTTVSGSDAYMIDFRPSQQIRFIVANAGSNGQTQAQSNAVFTQNNQWYHFVVTYDNNNVRFYNNGVLINTKTQTGSSVDNSNPLRFGANSLLNGDWFNGKLDDIRIYNRALTDSEVQQLYQAEAPPIDIITGLVAHYKMDGNAQDASGNNNHGIAPNGISYETNRFGNINMAASFDGINDYVSVNSSNSLESPTSEITISNWIYLDNATLGAYYLAKTNNSAFHYRCGAPNGEMYFGRSGIDISISTSPLASMNWYMLSYTYNGQSVKFYINGQLINTSITSGAILPNNTPLEIGRDAHGPIEWFKGKLDDIRIYNRALSDSEVQAIYQAEAPQIDFTTGLVAHYKMDGNAQDASGNGNHGTQQGDVNFTTATDRFGVVGKVAGFDGVNDYIKRDDVTGQLSGYNSITMTAWVKTNGLPNGIQGIAGKWYQTQSNNTLRPQDCYGLYVNQNLKFQGFTNQYPLAGTQVEADFISSSWQQVVFVHNNINGGKIYVNGVLKNSIVTTGSLSNASNPLLIGADNNLGSIWRYFNGLLDDIRIYNRTLSDAEVAALYASENNSVSLTTAMRFGGGQTILNVGTAYNLTTSIKNNSSSSWVGDVYLRVKNGTPILISSNNVIPGGGTYNLNSTFSPQTAQIGLGVTMELLIKQGTNDYVRVATVNGTVNPVVVSVLSASNTNAAPQINLSQSVVQPASNLEVLGMNFKVGQPVKILTYPTLTVTGGNQKVVNSDGSVIFNLEIPSTIVDNYIKLWVFHDNETAVTRIIKVNVPVISHLDFLYPNNENFNYSIFPNGSVNIKVKDLLTDKLIYPKVGLGKRKYKYIIGYKTASDSFIPIQETEEKIGSIDSKIEENINLNLTDSYFSTINTTKTIKFVVKDFYDQSIVKESVDANIIVGFDNLTKISYEWDKSFVGSVLTKPIGVAADGVSRMYITVEKKHSNSLPVIQNISISLNSEQGNSPQWVGRVKYATVQNNSQYSTEANEIQNISAVGTDNTTGKYWFWYVSPDDFNNQQNFDTFKNKSQREITATITITFSDNSTEIVYQKIKIFRPHIMLIHGMGGNQSYSWEKFNLLNNSAYNYSIYPVSMLSSGSVEDNAKILIGAADRSIYRSQLDNTIQGNIQKIRDLGIACNQVDVITHGTASNYVRFMYDKFNNEFYNNLTYRTYGKGFINKMISMNPTFDGSPLADMIAAGLSFIPLKAKIGLNGSLRTLKAFDEGFDPFTDSGLLIPSMIQAKEKSILEVEPTPALNDLRSFVNDRESQYFFDKPFNIPTHIIAGDIYGGVAGNNLALANSFIASNKYNKFMNILYKISETFDTLILSYLPEDSKFKILAELYLEYRDILFEITESEDEYSKHRDKMSEILKLLDCLKVLGAISKNNDFPLDSDLMTPVSSMHAGLNNYDTNVTLISSSGLNFENFYTTFKDQIVVQNKVGDLLNYSANSSHFKVLPPLNYKQPSSPATNNSLQSIKGLLTDSKSEGLSNTIPKPLIYLNDTTLVKIINPIRSSTFKIGDELLIQVSIPQVDSLKDLEVGFMSQDHEFISLSSLNTFKATVEAFAKSEELVVAQAVFNTDSAIVVVTDTLSIKINDIDKQLSEFNVLPKILNLPIGGAENPVFEFLDLNNLHFSVEGKVISSQSSNYNVAFFDLITNKIIALNKGECEITFIYKGLQTKQIVIVGSGGVPYPQTITTNNLSTTTVCTGQTLQIPFIISGGVFEADNEFMVQISDKTGENFRTIEHTGNVSPLTIKIPNDLVVGTGYKIRVVSTNVPVIGSNSLTTLTVTTFGTPPTISTNKATFWSGESLTLTASACPSGQTIKWSDGSNTTAITIFPTESVTYTAVCKDATCETANSSPVFISKNFCPLDYTRTADVSSGENIFKASNSIQADNIISGTGTKETLEAKSIILNPGFEAKQGVIFKVLIGGCTN